MELQKPILGSIVAGVLATALLTACGGSAGAGSRPAPEATRAPTQPSVALKAPTPSPTVAAALKAPTSSPIALATPKPSPASAGGTDAEKAQFELGKKIFLVDATDGVACQVCHGPTALGKIGPNIRGKRAGDIKFALETVDAMSFLRLNQKQVEAVAAYLKWLATQPK